MIVHNDGSLEYEPGDDNYQEPRMPPTPSLRDYFAARAMQGKLSAPDSHVWFERAGMSADALYCYEVADAMIRARNQPKEP